MSHPLDDVKNTPWGLRVDRDLIDLKGKVDRWGGRMSSLEAELRNNTQTTNLIKKDTEWLRDMFKGGKAFGSFMVPMVLIIGGIVAIIAGVLGWFHGKV